MDFDKENLAFTSVVTTPVNIMLTFIIGYIVTEKPFKYLQLNMIVGVFTSTYAVLYML